MGNTADLATVQKTIIDTPHKESKSQWGITERGGVQGVLYQSILNAKLTGRMNLDRKMCTSNRDERKLENTVKQSWFKHLGELHKEWTEAGVSASRVTTLRHLQEKSYQDTSETETSSEASYLGYGEELDCWSVLQSHLFRWNYILHFICKSESGGREERHRIHVAWGPLWSFHSQWWFGLPCHLLVLVHCVFWGPQSTIIYQDIIEHFMLPSADKLYGEADLIFQQDLSSAHTAKATKSWFNEHGVTVLDWPANTPDLNPRDNLDERHQTQQCRWPEGHSQRNLGFTPPQQYHATPHWGSN